MSFDGTRTGLDPDPAAEGESWAIVMQRAWIKFHGNEGRTWPHQAAKALTGRSGDFRYSVSDADFARFASALADNRLVTVATGASPDSLLIGNHAYTLVATSGSGLNRSVQVRNPWSYDGGASGDNNPNDGLVWIPWTTFLTSMRYSNVV